MKVFRGSLPNVLKRYYDCAKKYKGDIIIRITSDCPLLEYKLIDKLFLEFNRQNCDYLSNVHPATFPDGYDVEVLEAANEDPKDFRSTRGREPQDPATNNYLSPKEKSNFAKRPEEITPEDSYATNHPKRDKLRGYNNA